MKRDLIIVTIIWLVLTLIGEVLAQANMFPLAASEEAGTIDSAFRLLTILGVPVFTFVLAVLIYSVIRFRSRDMPTEDGPAVFGGGVVPKTWFVITAGLAILVMIHPGLTGLAELRASSDEEPDLVVRADSARWAWVITYPEHKVTTMQELVLPVNQHIRFEINSLDVLHSFWVPAFRMKIDAVPGRTTTISLTPTEVGSFQDDQNLRLQCAELCGLHHATMQMPVRVVEQKEFEEWIARQKPGGNR